MHGISKAQTLSCLPPPPSSPLIDHLCYARAHRREGASVHEQRGQGVAVCARARERRVSSQQQYTKNGHIKASTIMEMTKPLGDAPKNCEGAARARGAARQPWDCGRGGRGARHIALMASIDLIARVRVVAACGSLTVPREEATLCRIRPLCSSSKKMGLGAMAAERKKRRCREPAAQQQHNGTTLRRRCAQSAETYQNEITVQNIRSGCNRQSGQSHCAER